MTRLFLRFYLGVLLILLTAWGIQAYVSSLTSDRENVRVIERAFSGGLRAVKDRLDHADDFEQEFDYVKKGFEYPVEVYEPGPFREAAKYSTRFRRLFEPDQLVFYDKKGGRVAIRLDSGKILVVGPLPTFVGPSRSSRFAGLGLVLLFAALAIALLLRPVVRQLNEVERAASDIAAGDLAARVDTSRVPRGRRLASAFNTMADRTERLLQTQRNLLQAVSHELRTPISRMRFAIDLIGSAKTDKERQSRLESLDQSSEELSDLVGELLSFAKAEASATGSYEAIDAREVIDDLVNSKSETRDQLAFDSSLMKESLSVWAEPGSFRRVMSNLLNNASRFAESRVEIRSSDSGSYTIFEVEDDGPGIPPESRERVLDPFVRLEDQPAAESEGVGLGLALVQRILQSHGGTVEILEGASGGCKIRTLWPHRRDD